MVYGGSGIISNGNPIMSAQLMDHLRLYDYVCFRKQFFVLSFNYECSVYIYNDTTIHESFLFAYNKFADYIGEI